MFSIDLKQVPWGLDFSFGKMKKSQGTKSGEYRGFNLALRHVLQENSTS